MSEKEPKDDNVDKTATGTRIVNLHLSDIFKTKEDFERVTGKEKLISEIIEKGKNISDNKDKMIKIKLNGSYCKYFRINPDTFKQNDEAFSDKGTLDETGVFVFTGDTELPKGEASSKKVDTKKVDTKKVDTKKVDSNDPKNVDSKILVLLDDKTTLLSEETPAENEQILVLLRQVS